MVCLAQAEQQGVLGHATREEGEPPFLDAARSNSSLHLPGASVGVRARLCLVSSLRSALVKRTKQQSGMREAVKEEWLQSRAREQKQAVRRRECREEPEATKANGAAKINACHMALGTDLH